MSGGGRSGQKGRDDGASRDTSFGVGKEKEQGSNTTSVCGKKTRRLVELCDRTKGEGEREKTHIGFMRACENSTMCVNGGREGEGMDETTHFGRTRYDPTNKADG